MLAEGFGQVRKEPAVCLRVDGHEELTVSGGNIPARLVIQGVVVVIKIAVLDDLLKVPHALRLGHGKPGAAGPNYVHADGFHRLYKRKPLTIIIWL